MCKGGNHQMPRRARGICGETLAGVECAGAEEGVPGDDFLENEAAEERGAVVDHGAQVLVGEGAGVLAAGDLL